jgi:hypothetical protein
METTEMNLAENFTTQIGCVVYEDYEKTISIETDGVLVTPSD